MNKRVNLGFEDDDLPAEKGDVLDLSAFQAVPAKKPDQTNVAAAAAKAAFKSREPKVVVAEAPPAIPRNARGRRRTGRNAQINLKATAEAITRFYQVADDHGLIYGEAFEKAVALLEKSYLGK